MKNREVPIIIPSYEPDSRLLELLKNIVKEDFGVIIVDDGSGQDYQHIFEEASKILGDCGVILHHEVNKGKGRALKTAFSYVLENIPEAMGVVTADSDGQHTVEAIRSVKLALLADSEKLILGVRCFDGEEIPWKSVFGNKLTIKVLSYVAGVTITDTQTGLRGIPRKFMKELLDVRGERFEFETEMLVESAGKYAIKEVPIETIYDSKENHQTHFNPLVDSIKIYKVLGRKFIRYIFSSLSSSLLDLTLFAVFCAILKKENGSFLYVTIATIMARIVSATYNFAINYKIVFKSNEKLLYSIVKYAGLAIAQMICSAGLTTLGVTILTHFPEVLIKVVVDTILFLVSYKIQQQFVFRKKRLL